jgi:peptidyl-prolyl cis-trans isomerase D
MLEAIRERAQSWVAKLILALIAVPFALWGVDSYIRGSGDTAAVATVGKQDITLQEFSRMLREQQQRMGSQADKPEIRQAILDAMIHQRLLVQQAAAAGLTVPEGFIEGMIAGVPVFQEGGRFSQKKYEDWLRQQGMTPQVFMSRLRDDLLVQQLESGFLDTVSAPKAVVDNVIRVNEQQRSVAQALVSADRFLAAVKPDPEAAKAYYDKHADEFRIPERVKLAVVVLSQNDLMQQIAVSEEEAKQYYASHAPQYQTPEERRASHILVTVSPKAGDAERKAAEEKARQLAVEAKKNPAAFAELAKKNSQDPGSAEKGGDLGFFGRGMMVKPFEEAVFAMKTGEISGPVKSDFGYHVIRLTEVRAAKARPFEAVRGEIEMELRKQKASRKFAEVADTFGNTVYEQSDSLKPAADALKLKIQTTDWLSKDGPFPFNSDKLRQAVFSDDVLKNKRNTEAVEVAPNTLAAARVVDYQAATMKPFAEVKDALLQRLRQEQAVALAVKQGKEWLAQLRQGRAVEGLSWGSVAEASRLKHPEGYSVPVLQEVFKADVSKLPAYAGAEEAGRGFVLVKVSGVKEAAAIDDDKRRAYGAQLNAMLGREYGQAFLKSLKEHIPVTIKKENLEKSGQAG